MAAIAYPTVPTSVRWTSLYIPVMPKHGDLARRIAVVTGAASGLGAAMARKFAEAGMSVAALDIDGAGADATAAVLADELGVQTTSFRTDVGDAGSVAAAATHVESILGGCDVVCANVGVEQFGAVTASPRTTGRGSST